VQGELFVVFEFWFGGLRFLLEHGFVSDVSSRCSLAGDFAPKSPLNRIRFGGFSVWVSS
jgi:hypothetical protein